MRKESKKFSLWQRFGALAMAAVLVLGMIPVTGAAVSTNIGTTNKIEDPETLTRPQEIYGDNTLNAGKITVGKSVSKDAITVDGVNIGLTGENNFLITISQTAQVMGLSSETSVPVDVVFVLDTSGSMNQNSVDRASSMVTAANAAIATLMSANEQNRVAVVAFSSDGYGDGTSGDAAASVLSSLAHYSGEAATNHLQWVNDEGDVSSNGSYIAGRDTTTITTNDNSSSGTQTKTVNAFRNGHDGGTNIQAGIVAGANLLTNVANTTYTDPDTNETVTRIPFLIVISDGQPTYVYDDEAWYDPTTSGDNAANQIGPGSGAYEGNGFVTALTAAYYKGKITEHYYGNRATNEQRCFVYTMGVEVDSLSGDDLALAQITLDPATYTTGTYATGNSYFRYGNTWDDDSRNSTNGWKTYWDSYVSGSQFNVRVSNSGNYTFTADSIAASKQYVNGVGYTGGLVYNDDYFAATDVDQLGDIFERLIRTIQEKAISSPTKVDSYGDSFSGYVTFTDPLGEYMELKNMTGLVLGGQLYQGAAAAQLMTSGSNASFNAYLRNVLKTRLSLTASDDRFANEEEVDAFVESLLETVDGNSITWWGNEYHTGEEDVHVQVMAPADNDTIAYITADTTEIPEGADYVCRSYFFGSAERMDYLAFVVRVQRSLTAPYQQTVVISAPASLLSMEKVLIHESVDSNGTTVYTASVEAADPARVVYEVGLWDTINAENVANIVSDAYKNETVNGSGQKNVTVNSAGKQVFHFFTNDWNRSEAPGSHHRPMAKATFDAAADNGFYTYQQNTLIVDANGNAVTSNPAGTKAYYVREYYDWANASQNSDGTYAATKRTQRIPVDIPAGTELVNADGKWYIPKGAYTAATLVVNGDDTDKTSNDTNTSTIVAHPHRTGDSGNSHYTVLLGNNGAISLVSDPPEPTKTVSNVTNGITDANGKSVMVGDVLEYKVTAKNYNTVPGTLVITDTVPAGTELVSVDNGGVHSNGKITWTFENLAGGAEKTVSFQVRVTAAALDNAVVSSAIQNTATAKLNNGPEYKTNTTSNPPQGKKVIIQGDATGSSVQVGDLLQYFIEFHNDTGAVAPTITIVDKLPAGTDFVYADMGGVYDAQNHTVTWTFNNVAAGFGEVVSFSVQVNSSARTDIENSAQIKIGNNSYTTNKTTTTLDKGSLTLKKTLVVPSDLKPAADTFTLTLKDPTGKLNGTFSGVEFVDGVATVDIEGGQSVTIEGLASGTTILVTENVPAGFKVSITGNGQAVIPVNGNATVELTNTYAVSSLEVILQGNKTLNGASPDNETFGFTVVPCKADGTTITDANGITGEVTLTKDTKAITFGKLAFTNPGTYHYLVSEVNGGQTGVTYTTVQYLVTIVVKDNGAGALVQDGQTVIKYRSGTTGAFAEYTGTMLFTNVYQPLSTSVTLKGHKTLNGRDLKAGEFTFVVTENGHEVSTGTNDDKGNITFKPITYTSADPKTHTYVISELVGNLSGVTYSNTSYTITVEVVDVDGQLVATVKNAQGAVVAPAAFGSTFEFVNTFKPKEVAVTLEAKKELKDQAGKTLPLSGGEFSFVVKDQADNQVASGSNDANGKITFSKIEYFLADLGGATSKIFQYKITELEPDSGVHPSMYYDGSEFYVSVTVTYDPATGTLSVGKPAYPNDITFNNIDNPDTITVDPLGTKHVNQQMPSNARFSFSVIDVETNKLVTSGVSTESGAINFSDITYDYDDLGDKTSKVFRYWITEDQGGTTSAGITYDSTKYLMVVTLSKNGTNALTAAVEYFSLDPAVDPKSAAVENYNVTERQADFENTYAVTTGTEVTMKVEKNLVGRDLRAGEFTFGLYHLVDDVETLVMTATNAADGTVTFVREYAPTVLAAGQESREITYVIKELDNKVHGVDYSAALAKPVYVKVTVTHAGGVLQASKPQYSYTENSGYAESVLSFTNTYTPDPAEVTLTGTKVLTGGTLQAGQFSFVVLDERGKEVAWSSNAADGSITFSKIVYTYKQFQDAPKDANGNAVFTYMVKEVIPDIGADSDLKYDTNRFQVEVAVSYNQSTGELTASASYVKPVVFYNNPATIAVKPEGTKTIISSKGEEIPAGLKFSFRVTGIGEKLNDLYTAYQTPAVEATGVSKGQKNEHGKYDIDFTELVFDYDDVGKSFYYLIDEVATSANTVIYATNKFGMIVTIGIDGENGALTKTEAYYTVDTADAEDTTKWQIFTGDVDFENDYQGAYAILNIQGTKDMRGKPLTGGEFDFRMQLLDGNGVPVPGMIVDGVNDGTGTINFGTLIFTDDQMDLVNPAQTYVYRVAISEIKPATNAIPGVTYSTKIYIAEIHWVVTKDDAGLHYGKPFVDAIYDAKQDGDAIITKNNTNLLSEKTDEAVKAALTFTNVYEVTTGTSVTMKVQKRLENRVLQAGEFTFGLYHVHDNGAQKEETLIMTATNAADGTVTFIRSYAPSVLTTHDGEITYVIRELSGNVAGVDYSQAQENPVYVTVIVADDDEGGLELISVTYSDKSGNPIQVDEDTFPTFTNTYTPNPVEMTLEAKKELKDQAGKTLSLSGGEFSFEVLDENNVEVAWGTNDTNGNIVFTNLAYDFDDAGETFTYTVKEVVPDVGVDPSLYYDPAVYTVTVAVTYDEVNGILAAAVTDIAKDGEPLSTMSFNNVDNSDTITVTPEGVKVTEVISGNIPADTQFSFTIYELDENGNRVAVGAGISGINGQITFSTLIYDFDDVGKTFRYQIVEDKGNTTHAGIIYDGAVFEMTVAINTVKNALTKTVTYSAPVAFNNKYQITEPATVKITANKNLFGRDLRDGEFGFNLFHLHDGQENLIAATTNGHDRNGDGKIEGDEIAAIFFSRTYAPSILTGEHGNGDNKTATIIYVIREQVNHLGGVDYSEAKPVYVKVEITGGDNGRMTTDVTYHTDATCTAENEITNPAFVNRYATTDTVFEPEVEKVLEGRDMVDDEFSFVITDLAIGKPVSYGLSKAAQSGKAEFIAFNKITYTYQQYVAATQRNAQGDAIFCYAISEIPGNLVNVNYDHAISHPIYLQVTVKDLGNGKLDATGKYYADYDNGVCKNELSDPTFVNSYTPIGITVTLEANKTLTGREAVDGEFSFQVRDAQGNVVATGGNYDSKVHFSGIGITSAMMNGSLEKDFIFTMEELNTNQGAVVFDTNKYYAKVTVTNNLATGKLEITSVTYFSDKDCQEKLPNAPTFVNRYEPEAAEVAVPIHKDLINRILKAGMFCFEVKHEGQVIDTIFNDDQGNAIFKYSYQVSVLADVTPDNNNVRSKTFTYTITEVPGTADRDDDNGTYTYDPAEYNVTVTVTDDGKGNLTASMTITKDGNAADNVIFTNRFTPDPITVDLDTAFGATKTIVDDEGNVLTREDVEFHFVVTDIKGKEITTGTARGADMVDGVMPIDFGTFRFDVEGEYRYRITESTTTLDGYVLDTTVWCAHVLVRYDPDTGKLSVSNADVYTHVLLNGEEEEGIQSQSGETPAFVNVYDAKNVRLHLTVEKIMDQNGDRTTVREHEFLFHLLNEDGTIAAEARNHHDGTVNFYLDYKLQDLNGLPSRTFKYVVKEVIPADAVKNSDGTYTLNGVTYTTKTETVTVVVTDNGKGNLVATVKGAAVTGSGTVDTGITFKNKYTAADVQVTLHAIKRMEGMPLADGVYSFILRDGDKVKVTGTNKADGTIVFDNKLTFTEPGTYTYTMVEVKGTKPGVSFDETSYTVTVVVTDNGRGNLVAKVIYTTPEGTYDHPVFTNIYTPASTGVTIGANKVLKHKELKADDFTFQLIDSQGAVISEAKNQADGTVSFQTQTYHEVGTHTYTIVEVIPAGAVENADGTYTLNGVTYDKTVYTVVVDVTDAEFDGALDHTVTYYLGTEIVDASKVVFTNTYTASDSNEVVIAGNKILENQPLLKDQFSFVLKDSAGKILETVTNGADGKFAFSALKYSFEDLAGKTSKVFAYTVNEVQGKLGGVTYDKTVYTVTVTVTDNGDGTLTAVAVTTGGKNDGKIVFTNVYATGETTAYVTAKKELSGKNLTDGAFTFELVNKADKNEVYTAANKADGTVSFQELVFTAAGTYVYEMREVAGNDKHYTYDDKVITVTVTVVDNGDGTLSATVAYSETAVFHNTFKPDAITVELEGTKDLTGRDQKAGEFDFLVKDAEGNVITTGTNKADGTIVFAPISVDAALEQILYITEVQGDDNQIEYDDYTYRVKLVVTNENGVLKSAVQYLDGDIVFYNEYEVPETPPTGDETPVFFYVTLMGISAAALVAVLVLGRKKERKVC